MAPTVARRDDGVVLVIGSPGADRITSAVLQTIVGFTNAGMSLDAAVAQPRAHVELDEGGFRVAHEAGLALDPSLPSRRFEGLDLFFGGVAAVVLDGEGRLECSADPRRAGGTAVGGGVE
jgi:gamma-glutamyltranspeptidase/glutathione hydrolase